MRNLFFLAFLFSEIAFGATWKIVATSISEDKFYIENESIMKNGNEVNYWVRVNLSKRDKEGYLSTKENYLINCKTREQKLMYLILFTDFDNKGSVIGQFDYSRKEWRPVSPDSVNNTIMKYVCNK
jgi:hypothetical protein